MRSDSPQPRDAQKLSDIFSGVESSLGWKDFVKFWILLFSFYSQPVKTQNSYTRISPKVIDGLC